MVKVEGELLPVRLGSMGGLGGWLMNERMQMDYVPMKGPLPGERYMPSNGTEGCGFLEDWCSRCERDKELNGTKDSEDCGDDDWCPIVAAGYRDEAVEWRQMPDGSTQCLAFAPSGHTAPPPRCEHTLELFAWCEPPNVAIKRLP